MCWYEYNSSGEGPFTGPFQGPSLPAVYNCSVNVQFLFSPIMSFLFASVVLFT